ncbi:hypothetical protein [Enterococcus diestrammenae]|uniref:Uncharacterized protein n=1 Tax=Enterococcus diestrammenae TaxID=1155073 RepID=A0ABV0F5C1_9ENTE|nr:hypothetical protein [Enterococcus diestrammenae]KAF1300043.1 hypothetical protein BAU18_13070 [Enterococcus diestrammenae]
MKVRKKPVIVDAVPFYKGLWEMKPDEYPMVSYWALTELVTPYPYIGTIEGPMKVSDGDYIIKGVNGEFYPCKPEIFEKTYEEAVSPSLTDDQHVVLESLKHYYSKSNYYDIRAGKEPMQAVDRMLLEAESDATGLSDVYYRLTEKQQFQVLAAFAEWGLSHE